MKFYLAHSFEDRKEVKKIWEKWKEKFTKHKFINPFFPKRKKEIFTAKDTAENSFYKNLNPKWIVEDDIRLIQECDAIVARLTGSFTIGTHMEIVWAYILHRKIYIICHENYSKHPWLVYHADKIFHSEEAFEKFL